MNTPRWLIRSDSIAEMEGVVKVHDLNPNAVRISKSLGDAVGMNHMGFHLVSVAPGRDSTEYHRHLYEEECIYVLSGTGVALIDECSYEIGPGDFLGFPRDEAAHSLTNTGREPLVCVVAGQRLEQDVCDYPHQGKRLYINGDRQDMVDLAALAGQRRAGD